MGKKLEERCNQLYKELDMKFDGVHYTGYKEHNKDFNVSWIEITCDSEEEWIKKIQELKIELNSRVGIQER